MPYAIENALFQWEEGERRIRDRDEPARADLERAVFVVIDELRRRLGSAFAIEELSELYGGGTDWACDIAQAAASGTDSSWVVDAAFARYAREAVDFGGGRTRARTR